ncbi:MAG TPA: PAS domain-containing protein [Methanosarcina sp.]|nr:PAS domain-containing protein [Methanosarcina sp.]
MRGTREGLFGIVFRISIRHMKSIVLLLVSLFLTDKEAKKTEINDGSWKETVFLWRDETESKYSVENLQIDESDYRLLVQNIDGFIGLRVDENFIPAFIDGAIKDVTGYSKEDFLSCRIKWLEIVIDEDLPLIFENIKKALSEPDVSTEFEYRIRSRDGTIKWVMQVIQKTPAGSGKTGEIQGFVRDITSHKLAEVSLEKIEDARIKEINHRVKNNLQVISSLLSLEAERFTDPEVLEAFRESQNRIYSMSLIHQELYIKKMDTIDFANYLRNLVAGLFNSYRVAKDRVSLRLDLEQVYMETNTAVALGIVVNELVSNALKHAFPAGNRGEIRIRFSRVDHYEKDQENSEELETVHGNLNEKDMLYMLTIEDNGEGLPEWVDIQNMDSLGLQLVNIFVEQIEGSIELKRDRGTKFNIYFNNLRI